MLCKKMVACALVVATGGLLAARAALADDSAFVITGSDLRVHASATQLRVVPQRGFVQIGFPQRDAVGLIYEPVRVPEATVSRVVAQTPALPFLAKMQVGPTSTLIDPDVDYLSARPGHIDENHSIIKAQQRFRSLQAQEGERGGAYLVKRAVTPRSNKQRAALGEIQPHAILLKPDVLDNLKERNPDSMPTLPESPRDQEHYPQMARAD